MRAAFSTWNDRIAPVFDVAREIHIVVTESGHIVGEAAEELPADLPLHRVLRLVELGVDTLVCGAISRPLLDLVSGYGIRVIPFVAGDRCDVVQAWVDNGLCGGEFAMPGCWRWGRRRGRSASGSVPSRRGRVPSGHASLPGRNASTQGRNARGPGRSVPASSPGVEGPGRVASGAGGGKAGRGSGPRIRRERRRGGPQVVDPGGSCVCPRCGHREEHKRGIPCVERVCPKCGTALTRE